MRSRTSRFPVGLLLCAVLAASSPTGAGAGSTLAPEGAPSIIFADGFESNDTSAWAIPYVVVLPGGSVDQTFYVEFAPVDSRADLVFSMDTTGSMGGEITNLKNGLSTIVSAALLTPGRPSRVATSPAFITVPSVR